MPTARSNQRITFVLPALLLGLSLMGGCAGTTRATSGSDDFVEIPNPALTMSPNAPETIWVPRSSLEKGVPRGRDLAKEGYQALQGAVAPVAPAVPTPAPTSTSSAPLAPGAAGLVDTSGKPAGLAAHFGLVVAVQGERVFFNLGPEDGIAPGRTLKIYRGGTVVKGLGLAPGEPVATVEVIGPVGNKGGYGVVKQGGPVQTNDLVVCE